LYYLNQVSIDTTYNGIQNPNNPFNKLAVLHNMGMDYIGTKAGESVAIADTESFVESNSADFLISNFDLDQQSKADFLVLCDSLNSVNMPRNVLFDSLKLTSTQQYYANGVFEIIEDDSTLQDILFDLSSLESELIETSVHDSLKAFPLYLLSLAKHSACYWYHLNRYLIDTTSLIVYGNKHNKLQDPPTDEEKDKMGKTKTQKIIEADLIEGIEGGVTGFIGGGIGGAIVGAVTGPGIVFSSALGAFSGGLGGLWAGTIVGSSGASGGSGGGGYNGFAKSWADFQAKFKVKMK
jgi:hypothetical protein